MEVVEEEEEMSEDVRLFVELTSGSVGDVRLRFLELDIASYSLEQRIHTISQLHTGQETSGGL